MNNCYVLYFLPTYFVYTSYLQFNCKALKFDSPEMRKRKLKEKKYPPLPQWDVYNFFHFFFIQFLFFISYLTDFFTPLAFTLNLFIFYRLCRHNFFHTQREIEWNFYSSERIFCFCGLLLHVLLRYMHSHGVNT